MSVNAFTVDGKILIDTSDFNSAIKKVTDELALLGNSTKELMEMGGGNWNFNGALNGLKTLKDDLAVIKEDIATMNTEFANTQGINALKSEIATLRTEMDAMKERIAEMGTVAKETVTQVGNTMSNIVAKTSEEVSLANEWVSAFRVADASLTPTIVHLGEANKETIRMANGVQKINVYMDKMTGKMGEVSTFSRDIGNYFMNESRWLKQNVALIEREATATQRRATALAEVSRELMKQGSEIKKNLTYEEEMVSTENLFKYGLAEEMRLYAEQVQLQEQIRAINESDMAIRNGIATNVKDILAMSDEQLAILREEIALEEQKLGVIGEENALINEQGALRQRNAKGNDLDKMGYLPRRIGSMALTMWGFNEIMDIYETTTANLNARGSMKYFGDQLMTNERYLTQTNQTLGQVRRSLDGFGTDLDKLQKKYQKIDMTVIGANAEESAYKYGVQADKLGDLAEVYAIYGSEFVKQGRTQEDSILAVNDALDGEVRRLKEVNIKMEDLKEHGYKEGDTASLIDALNEIAKERGYDVTAQNITNLSDAITVLELKISQGLASAFEYIEPLLREVTMDFIYMIDALTWLFGIVNEHWNDFMTEMDKMFGVQKVQAFTGGMVKAVGILVTGAITFGIIYKVVKSLKGALSSLFGIFGKGESLGGEVAKDTGGIAKETSKGGFKDNFMSQWAKTGKDVGKIARAFVDIAVIMVASFVLIEIGIGMISGIGATYDALKPQFDSGIEFIKEYGLMLALLGGALLGLSYLVGKVPDSAMEQVGQGAYKVAMGMAIAMGLIAEAIVLLNAPLLAIATLGAVQEFAEEQINDGLAVIRMFANALHTIEQDDTIGWFIIGFVGLSAVLGFTADVVAIPLAIGIATSLLLVAEAIVMLNAPLVAIASLGYVVDAIGQESIQQGAEALKVVGQALQTIANAVPSLLIVDVGVLGQELMDLGSKLITGKDGLTYLSEEIIPNLATFVDSFNNTTIDPIDTATVENLSQVASQLPTIKSAIDTIRTSIGNGGTGGMNILGFQIGGDTSSLKPKLDILYQDIKDVIDFANKFGQSGSNGAMNSATAITQMATAVSQLQAKLNLMITTITTASPKVQGASKSLGSAIKVGFNEGSQGFNTAVISVLAKGISEVQHRYDTWHSGGVASAQKLADGFDKLGGKLKASISEEMGYALAELDNYQDDFYNKGAMLGQALVDGFKSKDALDQNSPAKITKSIREELGYSMEALNDGRMLMYNGGVALGQALYSGYNSYGNLRTNVDVLASKGVSSEQIQATARSVQANANKGKQVPQISSNTINIDMSNSTIIGVQDLDSKIRQAVEKAIVTINSPNGAIGY